MKLINGSPEWGLTVLHPACSEHGVPAAHLSRDPVIAAFYTIWRIERPYSWVPYGLEGTACVFI